MFLRNTLTLALLAATALFVFSCGDSQEQQETQMPVMEAQQTFTGITDIFPEGAELETGLRGIHFRHRRLSPLGEWRSIFHEQSVHSQRRQPHTPDDLFG